MNFPSNSKMLLLLCAVALLLPGTPLAQVQRDSLAQTPPMGWNSWNKFQCNVSEELIKSVADSIATNGMKDAGYEYVVIDDCWQVRKRHTPR
jgi:alpha-galactosidase